MISDERENAEHNFSLVDFYQDRFTTFLEATVRYPLHVVHKDETETTYISSDEDNRGDSDSDRGDDEEEDDEGHDVYKITPQTQSKGQTMTNRIT